MSACYPKGLVQSAFIRLATGDLRKSEYADVKILALAIWYERFVPNFTTIPKEYLHQAGYLVDKLMRYSCVEANQKSKLRDVCTALRAKSTNRGKTFQARDQLARDWGVSYDINHHARRLLKFQKRHYKHVHGRVPPG